MLSPHGPPVFPQDVAAALERYFAQHSRSFTLMLRDQQGTAQPFGAGGSGSLLAGLPTGLTGGTLESALATHGTSLPGPPGERGAGAAGIGRCASPLLCRWPVKWPHGGPLAWPGAAHWH